MAGARLFGLAPRRAARRVAQRLGMLPVLGPGPPPSYPPDWRTGPPDFVGVGVQKAGTTWWYSLVAAHPSVVPAPKKELHFFANFWREPFGARDVDRYHSYFPRPEGRIGGEWTPRYVSDFWTPPLLARAAPRAKILVLVRDPVQRYASGLTVSIGDGLPPYHPDVAQDAMARGFYFEQLSRLLSSFDREQLLVLQYEACRRDVYPQLAATYRFLGIDPSFVPPAAESRVNPTEEKVFVPEETNAWLRDLYHDDVLRLVEAFPEIDLSLWPSFAEEAGGLRRLGSLGEQQQQPPLGAATPDA